MDEIIIRNSARCPRCGDEIVSRHKHDFVRCSCEFMAVDGGSSYLKRLGSLAIDTSIVAVREPEDLGDENFGQMQDFAHAYHEEGWRPGKSELGEAPLLSPWSWRDDGRRRIIVGIVTGHDDFDDGTWLATTIIIGIDEDAGWCRSTRRFYRLGELA
jgi:ribosomal protein S27AE